MMNRGQVIAGVLAIVTIVGLVLWFKPWEAGGTVRFDYRVSFTYFGSEDNAPLENVVLKWSAPKMENSVVQDIEGGTTWELYYIEDDNTLTLQATENEIINLRGNRKSQLEMYAFGHEYSGYGPVLVAWFDRLYPREVFIRLGYGVYDKTVADELTLKVRGQTDSVAGWHAVGQENQRIDFSFWVGFWRENELIEQFEWIQENMTYGWAWLWPV